MKDFILGFLVASLLFTSYFGFCPHSRDMRKKANKVECEVLLRVILDQNDGKQKVELPGSFILDNE